jgi:DnaJ-domain-containing protein 1
MSGSKDYRPKFGFDIRIKPDGAPKTRKRATSGKPCGVAGCPASAEWHAPKSRKNMDERIWLCREHLRAHNEHWNFFEGMSDAEIERHCNQASLGHRPTWPIGRRGPSSAGPKGQKYWSYGFEDGFAFLEDAADPRRRPRQTTLTKGQLDALDALGLEEAATLSQVKARYKELVKRFHPDTNGGDRGKEERLKQVIRAYGHLRASGFARGNP